MRCVFYLPIKLLFKILLHAEIIDLTNGSFHEPSTKYWIKDLLLYPSDKQSLVEGDWLTDSVINAAQTLLKKSFLHVGELQPTILAETLGFAIGRGEFIQILNISNNHWLTVSNIGCSQGHVNVYDSIPSGNIPERTKRQIYSSHTLHKGEANQHLFSVSPSSVQITVVFLPWHLLLHCARDNILLK